MLSSSISVFDRLPQRPPTPPHKISAAIDDAIGFLDDSNEVDRLINKSQSDPKAPSGASNLTPASSQDAIASLTGSRRVDFSPSAVYIARPGDLSSPNARLEKRTPSVKDARPLKSILKVSNAPPPTPDDLETKLNCFSPEVPGSFNKMLQSVIHQLTGASRDSRLDAYLTLNGALTAYQDVPAAAAMAQKLNSLMQFLARDMAWRDPAGNLDTKIIAQALRATMSILMDHKVSEKLDDDFRVFLIDRSIVVMEQQEMPKQIVKLHMSLLAQQRFRPSIMTPAKAEKAVNVLRTIEERCSGNNVVATRLVIYSRLLEQSPTAMVNKIRDWLEHVFHGMLSSVKEIRQRGIETCTRAGVELGQWPQAGKALDEMFDTEVEEGQTYCDYLSLRLIQMIGDREIGYFVPQIWSAVVLFFRSRRKPLEKWPKFKSSWLMIIQKCMNSSDLAVRYQATFAWNKLIFAVMPDESTPNGVMTMFKAPIESGLKNSGADKFSKQVRQYTFDTFYNLLHYALRPGLTHIEVDNAWEFIIDPVLWPMVKASAKGRHEVCRILNGLLSTSNGIWNANAALGSTAIKVEDLPRLDPRWVRSRLARILKLLEPVIEAGMWSSAEANTTVNDTWCSLMQSVADAGAQEVKPTHDLKQAIALLVSMFRRLWNHCTTRPDGADERCWLGQYGSLVDAMLVGVGAAPFAEEILATTESNDIEVAPTPSHRSSKRHSAPTSPLVILLDQFYHPSNVHKIDASYETSATAVLQRIVSSKSTAGTRLDLLNRSSHACTVGLLATTNEVVLSAMWRVVAKTATNALKPDVTSSNESTSQNLGHSLRSSLDILKASFGLKLDADTFSVLTALYDTMVNAAESGAGDGAIVLAIMEPLAQAMIAAPPTLSLPIRLRLATHMLLDPVWPRSRQAIDNSRKALWGVGLAPYKATIFDPFEHVYELITDLMISAYASSHSIGEPVMDMARQLCASVVEFLKTSPISLLGTALRKVQKGFAVWIGDNDRKTSIHDMSSNMVRTTWAHLIQLMHSLPVKDSRLVKALEPLLVAGFASPYRDVVNATILFWNETFGNEELLEYPINLEAVLRARRVDAIIALPTFPDTDEDMVPASLPAFYESQSQPLSGRNLLTSSHGLGALSTHAEASPFALQRLYGLTMQSPIGKQATLASTAKQIQGKSGGSTPKARLRHDDSEIEFAPIVSSPIPPPEESQLLTDHQKEVKVRQQQSAQLFPDLLSSPMAQSIALPRSRPKRLDFKANLSTNNETGTDGTPTRLVDANALASDDPPSSPTPSSARAASQGQMNIEDDLDDDNNNADYQDPPSSPPHGSNQIAEEQGTEEVHDDVGPEDTTVEIIDFARIESPNDIQTAELQEGHQVPEVGDEPTSDVNVSASENPSDSRLPDAQLQMEQEIAEISAAELGNTPAERSEETRAEPREEQIPDAEQAFDGSNVANHSGPSKEGDDQEWDEDEVSRVENSFVEPDGKDPEHDEEISGSQQSQKPGRKRKRPYSTAYTSKKRKQQSPFKRIWSSFVGANQDDDDIGDEIVVASARPSSSPTSSQVERTDASSSQAKSAVSQPAAIVKEEPRLVQPPPKRGPGRPRKSETPTPSQPGAGPSKTFKRKASTLSNASIESSNLSTSFVKDTPAVAKVSQGEESQNSGHVRRRKATAVEIKRTKIAIPYDWKEDHQPGADTEDASSQLATPDAQLANEEAAANNARPILTPRSILGRLRNALTDLRGMVLGSQEEREFDDVLFELRRETHDAGRRGRRD